MPSLSSASTTSHSPSPNAAFVPTSLTSPPMTKLGCQPGAAQDQREHRRASWSCRAIPRPRSSGGSPASAAERGRRGAAPGCRARRRRAARRSCAAPRSSTRPRRRRRGTCSARLPTWTSTPAAASRSSTAVALMSEPLTAWPMRASSRAIALMPAPADADDVDAARLREVERGNRTTSSIASGGTGVLLDQVGDAARPRRAGRAPRAASPISREPLGRGEQLATRRRRAAAGRTRRRAAAPPRRRARASARCGSGGRSARPAAARARRARRPTVSSAIVPAPDRHTASVARASSRSMCSS